MNTMEKILIIENEPEQAEKIKNILQKKWEAEAIKVFTENFGSAIDFVRKEEPFLVILAVNPAGVNGLELAKQIRAFTERVSFLFVSDCMEFEFVKEALALGALNYIVKTGINEEELFSSIEKARESSAGIKEAVGRREKKHIAELTRHIEYSFMYTARFSEDFPLKIGEYRKVLNLGSKGYVMNIEIDSVEQESGIDLKRDDTLLYRYLKGLINQHNNCVIGPRLGSRILVFVDTDEQKERDTERESLADIRLAAHIIVGLREDFRMNVAIGLGSEKPIKQFHVSYEEAVRCLRYRDAHNVVRIRDIEQVDISNEDFIKLETQMLKNVKFASAKTIDLFAELLDMIKPLTEERRRNKIMELLVLAGHEARIDGQDEIGFINYGRLFDQYRKVPADKLEMWAYQNFEHILSTVAANRQGKKSESIRSALRYMEEYYMEPITLEEISGYVGVTPQHFSKMFKKELGINYIEWLTNYRIDAAKDLLIEGKSAIKEICYQVGYSDPNYFSRIFKKIVGISPKEYAANTKELP